MALDNRVAVITGAAGGLGSVVTRAFAQEGAMLALIGRERARLEALAQTLPLPGERLWLGAYDLRSAQAAKEAAQAIQDHFGKVHIVIHTVGGWVGGKALVDVAESELNDMLEQHLWSAFHTAQAFIPHLLAGGWGRFVVISSPAATHPPARSAPYAVGKAALEAMTLSLAEDLKNSGVTANILQVRAIDTEHRREAQDPARAGWTTPEEIAAAILYLCSEAGGRLNGSRLPLYG